MAIKKTQLYNSLWASCDKLRGGMDASQYKDYILTLLFMKYVTDKYQGEAFADITVFDKEHDPEKDPEKRTGCSFDDFIKLKGKKNIGEGMDKVIARLAEENDSLKGVIDIAHFNDEAKLGTGQEMVDKLTDLIEIFQSPDLDFSRNKANGDDLIGDAYEYLMRHFASDSGKSKGQFYTPAEVSRILANVVGIAECKDHNAKVNDPACGSGSLLIRALDAAPFNLAGFGQEKDGATAGLAKMNVVLHRKPETIISKGNTFSEPHYFSEHDSSELDRFDYIVANPPFSMKNWTDGLSGKEYGRFDGYGDMPPEKNGDYAWLLHILKTLKDTGKAAVILPHGVLFRGNAEATIRASIIKRHWIKGIISLPPNLFYGTGIAACVLVIDKEGAANRQGIFMIDASHGYVKDGNKNRLRERDIYRIVKTFNEQLTDDPKYARFVPNDEIEITNGCNLNITRYIDSSPEEDVQDIYAHLHGGIPMADVDGLKSYWQAFPSLKPELFTVREEGYYTLTVPQERIRQAIYQNAEFAAYGKQVEKAYKDWHDREYEKLAMLTESVQPQALIDGLAERLMSDYKPLTLLDKYDVYQALLSYWTEVMGDDVALVTSEANGYANARIIDVTEEEIKKGKNKGKMKETGWDGRLIPKEIVSHKFFQAEEEAIVATEAAQAEAEEKLAALIESVDEESLLSELAEGETVKAADIEQKLDEITQNIQTEESKELEYMLEHMPKKKDLSAYLQVHPLCRGIINDKGNATKTAINARLKEIRQDIENLPESLRPECRQLQKALELCYQANNYERQVKELKKELEQKCRDQYALFTDEEIIDMLVERKWLASINQNLTDIYVTLSRRLTSRIAELAQRYEHPLPELKQETEMYEEKVKSHLERMGFVW